MLRSHYIFSTGLLSLLIPFLHLNPYGGLIIASVISIISNSLIDYLGHEIKGKLVRRSPLTHTFFRSMLWGLLSSSFIFIYYILKGDITLYPLIMGLISGPSHLFLDIFTERGIYVKKKGKWRRFALAHFRYNNPIANSIAILLGFALIFVSINAPQ